MDTKNKFLLKLKNYAFENQIPIWTYGFDNALVVIGSWKLQYNIFSLLTSCIFEGDLCLQKSIYELNEEFNLLGLRDEELKDFKFFNSGLSQREYFIQYISIYWTYGEFYESAVLYYLEVLIQDDDLPSLIPLFFKALIKNELWTSLLYKDMVKFNIFSVFTSEWLVGFFAVFEDFKIILLKLFEDSNHLLLVEKRWRLFRIMNAFSFYFSPKCRSTCFKDCVETKSYIPMVLALKIYQIKLETPDLTLNQLREGRFLFNFKENLITEDVMSEEIIDKLIEKNWSYTNSE